jgi:integrase
VLFGLGAEAQLVDVVDDLAKVVTALNLVLDLAEYLADLVFKRIWATCLCRKAVQIRKELGVIRTVQWGSVDFENRYLRWGKDKTASGTGRIVPLNQRAMAALGFWATHFPKREPEHYVFPTERYGAAGDKFCAKAYDIDPTKPIGSIKEAWEAAKLKAARILKGEPDSTAKIAPLPCRFHDLRHTAVSRMLNAGVPIAKLAKIVGWGTATMVRMAARYGHFTLDELRGAMDSISSTTLQTKSPVFSPVSEDASGGARPN